jgi:hypothetical protein
MQRMTIDFDEWTVKKLKEIKFQDNKPMADFIRGAVAKHIKTRDKKQPKTP